VTSRATESRETGFIRTAAGKPTPAHHPKLIPEPQVERYPMRNLVGWAGPLRYCGGVLGYRL